MLRTANLHFRFGSSASSETLPPLPDFSQQCCRKCRREMMVEMILQTLRLLRFHLAAPEHTCNKQNSNTGRRRVSPERLQFVIRRTETELANVAAQCRTQYKDIWRQWRLTETNNASPDTNQVDDGSPTTSLSTLSLKNILSSFQFNIVSSRADDNPLKSGQKPWSPALCAICSVWINPQTICKCSDILECFPCSLSRLRGVLSGMANDTTVFGSDVSCSRQSSRVKNPQYTRRRRANSLPTNLGGCHPPLESICTHFCRLFGIELQDDLTNTSANLERNRTLSEASFVYVPSLSEVGLDVEKLNGLTSRGDVILETVLPNHIRFMPPTHYSCFFHGLYGNARDYSRFRNHMLKIHPDLHIFVPDCYAGKAMGGVELLTSVNRDYLFLYRPHQWGVGRLPVTPDLTRHILPCENSIKYVVPRSIYGEPIRSKIMLSFVGHSLGGIIARSLITLDDFICTPQNVGPFLSSEQHRYRYSRFGRRKSTAPTNLVNVAADLTATSGNVDLEFINFVTFASPHNGIYESFGGLHAVSFLVPTGRDLMTASVELNRLASPQSFLALTRFRRLALYGNVNNDYLVGPFTSLVIDPTRSEKYSKESLPRRGSSDNLEHLDSQEMEFPNCVRTTCIKYPRCPMEIDGSGYLFERIEGDQPDLAPNLFRVERRCEDECCVHAPALKIRRSNTKRSHRFKRWGASRSGGSLIEHLRNETHNMQSFIKASLPMVWDLSSPESSVGEDDFLPEIESLDIPELDVTSSELQVVRSKENALNSKLPSLPSSKSNLSIVPKASYKASSSTAPATSTSLESSLDDSRQTEIAISNQPALILQKQYFPQTEDLQTSSHNLSDTSSQSTSPEPSDQGPSEIFTMPIEIKSTHISKNVSKVAQANSNSTTTSTTITSQDNTIVSRHLSKSGCNCYPSHDKGKLHKSTLRRRQSRSVSPHSSSNDVTSTETSSVEPITPMHHIRHFHQLHWRRFAVYIPSLFRAHACIIWHGRVDVSNLGEPIVHHFADEVFLHPSSGLCNNPLSKAMNDS